MNTNLSVSCQLLCASGCAYGISGSQYTPPAPFDAAMDWQQTPSVFVGGSNYINAALVGMASINGSLAIVVAFRGTLPPTSPFTLPELQDWFQDFMAEPTPVNGFPGEVHSGMNTGLITILQPILNQVGSLQSANPGAQLYITGHSKGAGLASLFAAYMAFQNSGMKQPAAVYTFASPMIGNAGFVSGFPASIPVFRFENYLDIVPWLPPNDTVIEELAKIPIIGPWFEQFEGWNYTPLGSLYYIDQNGQVSQPSSNPDWPVIIADLLIGIVDHNYLSKIANAHSHLCGGGYMTGACPVGVCG